ncbi:MAG: hypothetical protein JWP10_1868, partial [Nocardioidaceae bacterium]|nr:hypothetical protein [Nocardioidaceae bacterium]
MLQQDQPVTVTRTTHVMAGLFAAAIFAFVSWGGTAQAEPPVSVKGPVTDPGNVLGSDRAKVESALDDFFDETGYQLFVVYVKDFGGKSGFDWANATADTSAIGTTDILLAIATDERSYGISVPDGQPISDKDLTAVERNDILPRLRDEDWSGAAIAAARGYTEAAKDSSPPWGWIVFGVVIVFLVVAYFVHRTRRRYADRHPELDEHGQPIDPYAKLSNDEVSK